MKKILTALTAFLLCACMFSGCSCTPTVKYTFDPYWNAGALYKSTFKETAIYSVELQKDFVDSAEMEDGVSYTYDFTAVDNAYYTVQYREGQYKVTYECTNEKPEKAELVSDQTYKVTTEFSIKATYTSKTNAENVFEFNDTIKSTAYFMAENSNLSPIYSVKEYNGSLFSGNNIYQYIYQTELIWGETKVNFAITDKTEGVESPYKDNANFSLQKTKNDTASVKYTKGATLDNEQLFFTQRGVKLSTTYSGSYKIFDTAYKSLQTISVRGLKNATLNHAWEMTINGESKTTPAETPVCLVTFVNGNTTYSGTETLCYYQVVDYAKLNESSRVFLMKIVNKLNNDLGALVYTLQSVEVNA